MAVVVVAMVTINEEQPQALATYLNITEPLLRRFGAKILQRYCIEDDVIGARPAQSVIVVEYPDRQAVQSVFESDEYKNAIPHRDRAFSNYSVHTVQ